LRQIGGWMMVIIVLSLFVIVLVACMLFILKYNRPFARIA
jgi:lipoprotein